MVDNIETLESNEGENVTDTSADSIAKKNAGQSSFIGALSAGGRSMVYQATSFYLRTPMKLFRPARFDYLHYLRVLLTGESNDGDSAKRVGSRYARWPWIPRYTYYIENSSLGLLGKGLDKYGWRVIPDRILPPLVANSAAGVVLYTTYLSTLNKLSSDKNSRHPRPWDVIRAGFAAGAAQAIVSAPIDAIYTRSSTNELLLSAKTHNNLWVYGLNKLKEIGLVGCFGGFGLSLVKECLGFAAYFSAFELLRGQVSNGFINFLERYRELKFSVDNSKISRFFDDDESEDAVNKASIPPTTFVSMREEAWIHKAFVFVGGITAAFLLQVVQFPFHKIQRIHFSRLEAFDMSNMGQRGERTQPVPLISETRAQPLTRITVFPKHRRLFRIYYHSYLDTFQHIYFIHKNTDATYRWLYRGFLRNTIALIPGTTAGLLLLEYLRSSLSNNMAAIP
ncbi:LAMI_0H06876g1_1 [Lachancea mirantina]|uniref:LAMI_0H06876g1_1 n=1 Tax=Lachancea mirantina TaxID=1230905 RepID=A0A1G4KFC9_9SACH|nr:LAMI_0H06876g1_1 [Lachancea mirantina]